MKRIGSGGAGSSATGGHDGPSRIGLQILALLAVCSLGPGYLVVRRSRLETLASVALSWTFLYLTSGAVSVLEAAPRASYWGVTLGCALVQRGMRPRSAQVRRTAARSHRSTRLRHCWRGTCSCWPWSATSRETTGPATGSNIIAPPASSSNAPRIDTRFLGIYLLPAQHPFMNLLAAHFLAHTSRDFAAFQGIFLVTNLAIYLPLVLLAPHSPPAAVATCQHWSASWPSARQPR